MSYEAKIVADSISPIGVRLTTLQVTFPRFVLAEFNTHRMLSRNSASSRAIPVKKRIEQVENDPFIPEQFGKNRKGMQATSSLDDDTAQLARDEWVAALNWALVHAGRLEKLGVHKQWANRLLEPFAWQACVVTATDWDNFFHLRRHPDATPEFQIIAGMMHDVMEADAPNMLEHGEWHLPYISQADEEQLSIHECRLVSVARCARVSVTAFDGSTDIQADLRLARDKLLPSGHMSPFEHVAVPHDTDRYWGNFRGWVSYRKLIPGEEDILGYREARDATRP